MESQVCRVEKNKYSDQGQKISPLEARTWSKANIHLFSLDLQAVNYLIKKYNIQGGRSAKLDSEEFRAVLTEVEQARQRYQGKHDKSVKISEADAL